MSHWQPGHRLLLSPDSAFMLWCLKWWPHNVLAWHNPFHASFFAPKGQNLAWVTAVPSLALLAFPITQWGGPVLAYNMITLLAISANGVLAYLMARELRCDKFAAVAGAVLFYFSSYTWGQLLGHLNLCVTSFAVAVAYTTLRRCNEKIGPVHFAATISILLALQFGVSNEIYATLIVFMAMAAIIFFLMPHGTESGRRKVVVTGIEAVAGVLLSILWLSPYLYQVFANHVSGLQDVSKYAADPLNYLLPTQNNWLLGTRFAAVSSKFTGNITEQGSYLGLPVLLLLFAGPAFYAERLNRCLFVLFITVALCSLGAHLTILGTPTITMPWHFALKLPLIREALPIRFGLYTSLLASLLASRALTYSNAWPPKLIAGLGVLLLWPNLSMYRMSPVPSDSFFKDRIYQQVIPVGSRVMVLPSYGFGGYQPALWQEEADFSFDIVNGLAGKTPEGFDKYQWYYYGGSEPEMAKLGLLSFLKNTGAQFVLSDDRAADALTETYRGQSLPYRQYGHIRVTEISANTLDNLASAERAPVVRKLCKSLVQLARYGVSYEHSKNSVNGLAPIAVSDADFVRVFGTPLPSDSPNVNWTEKGFWLGAAGDNVALGISPLDPASAQALYQQLKASAQRVYYPYPNEFQGEAKASSFGQFLMVLKPNGALSVQCVD